MAVTSLCACCSNCHQVFERVQDLMLALRVWPLMPPDLISECPMLPNNCPAPSVGAFTGSQNVQSASTAGLAFLTPAYLSSVGEALADASASHPRVHSVWLTLLSLLIPGFTPVKVRSSPRYSPVRGNIAFCLTFPHSMGPLVRSYPPVSVIFAIVQQRMWSSHRLPHVTFCCQLC